MGSNKKPVEKKRKKKGRPSLLDIQKRSLRLQKQQQQQNPNPNPNPASRRWIRRRNLNLDVDVDDENEGSGDGDGIKAERGTSSKETDPLQEKNPSNLGPTTTPLPENELLVFILDRLQKKDTYGVYSEPVDPNELPDYHEIIENPMDFGTVRKKLSSGSYTILEQFEEDIFLISSNAMRYNATDTIYYRQAQAIHELSKKSFENLRQESDDNEPEPMTAVRRGRPPTNNLAPDLSRRVSVSSSPGNIGVSTRASLGLRNTETFSFAEDNKAVKTEQCTGSASKGFQTRFGRKPIVVDESRRNTYKQPHPCSINAREPTFFTIIDGQKKQLMSVGLHMDHSYARSLARFAANLGPIGWAIAAKKLERALPPGTNFNRGWIRESEAHPASMPQMTESPSSIPLACASTPAISDRSPDSIEGTEPAKGRNYEPGLSHPSSVAATNCGNNMSKSPFQLARVLNMVNSRNRGFNHQSATGLKDLGRAKSSLQENPDSVPPGLNVSSMMVDSQ